MHATFLNPEESPLMHVKKEVGYRNSYTTRSFTGNLPDDASFQECRDLTYIMPTLQIALLEAVKAHVATLFEGRVTARVYVGVNHLNRKEFTAHIRFRHRIPTKGTSTKDLIAREDMAVEVEKCGAFVEDAFKVALNTLK